jgi:hypothetical protein
LQQNYSPPEDFTVGCFLLKQSGYLKSNCHVANKKSGG